MNELKTVVIGEGWAAQSLVALLGHASIPVYWIAGLSPRLEAPFAGVAHGEASELIKSIALQLNIDLGELQEGDFLREFKNKFFKIPVKENLWKPESGFSGPEDVRFAFTLNEIMDLVRKKISQMPSVQRVEGVPIQDFFFQAGSNGSSATAPHLKGVELVTGEEIPCTLAIYADRKEINGKYNAFQGRESIGALQAAFTHNSPLGVGTLEGFYSAIQQESGEKTERHVLGHFSSTGLRSFWTLFLTPEEAEDNHVITKKYRRIKQTVEKMFMGSSLLPEGQSKFMETVKAEQVKWIDSAAFCKGDSLRAPICLPDAPGVYFLTDGYGPSSALCQVSTLLQEVPDLKQQLLARGGDYFKPLEHPLL